MIALLVCAVGGFAFWRKDLAENVIRSLPDLKHLPIGFLQAAKWELLLPMIVSDVSCLVIIVFCRVSTATDRERALPVTTRFLPVAVLTLLLLIDFNLYAAFAPVNNPAKLETLIGQAMPPELAAEQKQLQPIRYQMMLNAVTGEFSPYWLYGHEMMTGYDPVLSERQKVFSGLDEAGRSFNLTMLELQDRTLDIFNVRYVFVPPSVLSESLADKTRWREVVIQRDPAKPYADYRIFENLRVLPRVWLAGKTKVAWEGDQLKMIRGQIVDPDFDPRQVALVDPDTAAKITLPPEGGTTNVTANAASIIQRSPTRLVVETNADKTSLLVLSEMFYPGWKATVDGDQIELLRVNYNLRGVQVPAGKHLVEIGYWPESLTKGAVISLTTALCLLAILIWEKCRLRQFTDVDAASESV